MYKGLTQLEMSQRLGINRSTYSKIERNPNLATVDQINAISEITGVPVLQIFLSCKSTKVD